MKYKDTEPQLLTERLKYIGERWNQLNGLSKDSTDRALKHLLLTNAGGAVAMLSFIGASAAARAHLLPRLALGCFVAGIVLVGILDVLILHHVERIFFSWRQNTSKYYENKLDWEDMVGADDNLSYTVWPEYFVGYLSFLCFITGAGIGVFSLLSLKL